MNSVNKVGMPWGLLGEQTLMAYRVVGRIQPHDKAHTPKYYPARARPVK